MTGKIVFLGIVEKRQNIRNFILELIQWQTVITFTTLLVFKKLNLRRINCFSFFCSINTNDRLSSDLYQRDSILRSYQENLFHVIDWLIKSFFHLVIFFMKNNCPIFLFLHEIKYYATKDRVMHLTISTNYGNTSSSNPTLYSKSIKPIFYPNDFQNFYFRMEPNILLTIFSWSTKTNIFETFNRDHSRLISQKEHRAAPLYILNQYSNRFSFRIISKTFTSKRNRMFQFFSDPGNNGNIFKATWAKTIASHFSEKHRAILLDVTIQLDQFPCRWPSFQPRQSRANDEGLNIWVTRRWESWNTMVDSKATGSWRTLTSWR